MVDRSTELHEHPQGSPGSPEAKAAGCLCPVIDNGHGKGCGMEDENGKPLFYVVVGCPLHDIFAALEKAGAQPIDLPE